MSLSAETLPEIKALVEAYPYCSTFVFLYLTNLAITEDVRYTSELRKWAIFLPDRRKLYRMVEAKRGADDFNTDKPEEQDKFDLIEEFLGEMRAAGADLPNEINYMTALEQGDYFRTTAVLSDQESKDSTDNELNVLKDIHPLSLIGSLSQHKMSGNTDIEELEANTSAMPQEDSPRQETTPSTETPTEENELKEELFTETLAKIYIKQQRYDKALRIIRSISLNYPEKNIYFADQIRFLEKLINNNK